MERIREYVNKLLTVGLKRPLNEAERCHLDTLIIEARSGEEEICVALRELNQERKSDEGVRVLLYGGGVRELVLPDGTVIKALGQFQDLIGTIRSLIPPPEPTPEEDAKTVDICLQHFVGCTSPWPGVSAACEALARLRKHLEKP